MSILRILGPCAAAPRPFLCAGEDSRVDRLGLGASTRPGGGRLTGTKWLCKVGIRGGGGMRDHEDGKSEITTTGSNKLH